MPEVRELSAVVSGTDVTVVTTAETVIISSPVINLPLDTHQLVIFGWVVFDTGTNTVSVTPRIRRGVDIGGALLGEEITETIKVAVGANEPFFKMATDFVQGAGSVQFSFTLEQLGASANGTGLEAGLVVAVL